MPDEYEEERGATAYEAYRYAACGKSLVTGDSLPDFTELPVPVQRAWIHAAETVCRRYGAIY